MQNTWVKPDFEEMGVSGECTAYAGVGFAAESSTGEGQASPGKENRPEATECASAC